MLCSKYGILFICTLGETSSVLLPLVDAIGSNVPVGGALSMGGACMESEVEVGSGVISEISLSCKFSGEPFERGHGEF